MAINQLVTDDLKPLCIDLDGTLTLTDTLWESCLKLLRVNPLFILQMLIWLLVGKAKFKQQVNKRIQPDPALLPYTPAFLEYLKQQKNAGRHLCLVTAASYEIAQGVANHLGLFDRILASDDQTNLSGTNKANKLVEIYGEKGFDYAGNGHVDLSVWQHAATAIPVNVSSRLAKRLKKSNIKIDVEFQAPNRRNLIKNLIKVMRPHQWAKNMLLFVPIILAHSQELSLWLNVSIAFAAFSLAASSIYIINDMLDIEADRKHPKKCQRPFASGMLSIPSGIALLLFLLGVATTLATQVNLFFVLVLISYIFVTTAYSVVLKLHALIDVFTLTSLYTLRIIAGAVAVSTDISNWLLAFSIFFFMSLAYAKRHSELHNLAEAGDLNAGARGYAVKDLAIIILFGVTSGYLSVMVLILYIQDLQASLLYSEPRWLWLISFVLLYWISHVWLLSHRGKMDEDPVLFALHDYKSYIIAIIGSICFLLAQ